MHGSGDLPASWSECLRIRLDTLFCFSLCVRECISTLYPPTNVNTFFKTNMLYFIIYCELFIVIFLGFNTRLGYSCHPPGSGGRVINYRVYCCRLNMFNGVPPAQQSSFCDYFLERRNCIFLS